MPAGNGNLTLRACNILKACREWSSCTAVCSSLGIPSARTEIKVALEAIHEAGLVDRRKVMTKGRPRDEYRVAAGWRNDA